MPRDDAELFFWLLVACGVLFIVLPIAFVVFLMVPMTIGGIILEAAGNSDEPFWAAWLAGLAVYVVLLTLIFLLVGFVRFSWYAWA
jgi:hypothetical protein